MKFNSKLKQDVEKFKGYIILVEGKKDVHALKSLGFEKVYEIHKTSVSLRERIEEICSNIERKERVCILTDLDKKGKKLYMIIKPILQEHGVRLDSTLRGILIKSNLSHIEGLATFMNKLS